MKLTAPLIFDGENFLCENSILVLDEIGLVEDIIVSNEKLDDCLYLEDGILCPGFINAHCHLELSYLHGKIAPHTGMTAFLSQVIQHRNHDETLYIDAGRADQAMWQQGIQAVGDVCNTTKTNEIKKRSAINYHSFIELLETKNGMTSRDISTLENTYMTAQLKHSFVPHSPYLVSKSLFMYIFQKQHEPRPIYSIHYNESLEEKEMLQKQSGPLNDFLFTIYQQKEIHRFSYNEWVQYVPQKSSLILVHNTFITETDIDYIMAIAKQKDIAVSFCLCPYANAYINREKPPLELLENKKLDWCIGTDSLASTHTLSIFSEIQLLHQLFPKVGVENLLRAATYNGAKALHMEQVCGKIKVNCNGGIIHITQANAKSISPHSQVKRLY